MHPAAINLGETAASREEERPGPFKGILSHELISLKTRCKKERLTQPVNIIPIYSFVPAKNITRHRFLSKPPRSPCFCARLNSRNSVHRSFSALSSFLFSPSAPPVSEEEAPRDLRTGSRASEPRSAPPSPPRSALGDFGNPQVAAQHL